jgi:uncharacterized protein (TIGR03437 family)
VRSPQKEHLRSFQSCVALLALILAAGCLYGQSLPAGTQAVSIFANDVVWDATRSLFWVSTSAQDATYPNSILSINPTTAQVVNQIACGQPATHIAVSSDGQYLYASFDQLGAVQRYVLSSLTQDLQVVFSATNGEEQYATSLAVLPDQPGSFIAAVVTATGGPGTSNEAIVVYDGNLPRPNTALGPGGALFPQSAGIVDAWGAGLVVALNVDANGVSVSSAKPGFPVPTVPAFDGGRYVTDGQCHVFDTTLGSVIGRAAGLQLCVSAIDPQGGAMLAVSTEGTSGGSASPPVALTRYSLSTFRPLASLPLAALANELVVYGGSFMKTWGSDGVVINAGDRLVFAQLSLLQPIADSPTTPSVDPSGAIRIPLQAGGLAYDANTNKLLASIAGISGGSLGNTIVEIDPGTGAIGGSIFAGSEPGRISLTDDGTRLFVALNGAPLVVPVNLGTGLAEQSFSVLDALPAQLDNVSQYSFWSPEDLVTLAGQSQSVAVVRTPGIEGTRSIVVYDSGVARPNILTQDYLADRLYRADATNALFSLDLQDSTAAIYHLLVTSEGVAIDRQLLSFVNPFNGTFVYDSGKFYSSEGTVSSGSAPTQIGSFAQGGIPIPFTDQNAVVFANINGNQLVVSLFDTTTYRPRSTISLNTSDPYVLAGVRTGTTSFAVSTASEVILFSWSNLPAWPNMVPALQSVAPGVAKMPLLANAIAAAPDGSSLLVATSSAAGQYGNNVLTVNPNTAAILSSGYVGSEPVKLSVVPGGNEVYASVAGEVGIARFNLQTATRDLGFIADPTNQGNQDYIWDIAAAADGSVAVSFIGGMIAAFDEGDLRPSVDLNNQSFADFGANYQLAFSSGGGILYGYGQTTGGLRRDQVSSSGLTGLTVSYGLTTGYYPEIRTAGELLYTSSGDAIDPERARLVAQFIDPAFQTNSGHVWPDVVGGRAYFTAGSNILVFDTNTYAEVGAFTLPAYNSATDGDITALVKTGPNLALLTSSGEVYIVSISAIPAIPNPIPHPPIQLPSTSDVFVIDKAANDIAYNEATNRLYATLPNSEGALGDSAVALDPATGVVTASYFGAVNPHLIRISDDGSMVYHTTGFVNNGVQYVGEGLRSIDLATSTVSGEFAVIPTASLYVHTFTELVLLPGEPGSWAELDDSGAIRIYDGAVMRPTSISPSFCTSMQPGADASRLYCYNGNTSDFKFSRLAVDANGVTLLDSSGPGLIGAYGVSILYYQGKVYTTNGRIIDPEGMQLLATVPASGSVAVDSGRIYYLSPGTSSSTPTMVLTSFDQNTLQLLETRTINVNSTSAGRLVPCGMGRLAFAAGQQIYVVLPTGSTSTAPAFDAGAVVSAASNTIGASGGELVSIFGQNLVRAAGLSRRMASPPSPFWRYEVPPLSNELDGTSVTIGGLAAPMLGAFGEDSSGRQEIILQVPAELSGAGPQPVVVTASGVASSPVQVSIATAHPGIFMNGTEAAVTHLNGSPVSLRSPATAGETIVIYCGGLGTVAPPVKDGAAAPSPAPQTTAAPAVAIGGQPASVALSGLLPDYVGVYQVQAIVPNGLPAGNVSLTVAIDGAISQTTQFVVR